MSNNNNEMKKELGMGAAMATVVGCVIGSGVFFKPTAIYTATGGAPGLAIIAWVVTSLVCLCAAMTFAEIAILIPETGGMPVYLKKVFGDRVGYLCGWMQTVVFYPGLVAALAVAVANQAKLFLGDGMVVPVAIVCIIIMVALNCMGAKVGGAAQTIFTVAKLIPLVLIMIFGFIRGNGNPIFDPMLGEGLKFGSVLGQLMIAVLFAYEGWTNVGAIAGEMKDPGRDLPKAIVGGVALIMAVYIIINLAYLWVLPADVMMNLESPASAVAMQIFGNMGGKIVSVGIMISAGGACNGFILSGSRTALYMAEQGDLPGSKALSKISGTGSFHQLHFPDWYSGCNLCTDRSVRPADKPWYIRWLGILHTDIPGSYGLQKTSTRSGTYLQGTCIPCNSYHRNRFRSVCSAEPAVHGRS